MLLDEAVAMANCLLRQLAMACCLLRQFHMACYLLRQLARVCRLLSSVFYDFISLTSMLLLKS